MKIVHVLLIAVLFTTTTCGGDEVSDACPVDGCEVMVYSDIAYADGRNLDVYAPAGSGRWPVVVVVHGIGQSRLDVATLAESIAGHGAVVFNISASFSVPPLDGINQIACALRFARARATDHGGETGTITLVGNSSGAAKGSIVAMDGEAYGEACAEPDGSALPDAFVGYEGPYDYATHLYGSFAVPELRETNPEVWEAVDPYSHIGGNQELVVRLVHGRDADTAWYDVPPEVSAEFSEALSAAGYDVAVTYVEGATHGSLLTESDAFDVTVETVIDVARG